MRVIEVSMERRRNGGVGETGGTRENPPTSGIVRHDSHLQKPGLARPGLNADRIAAHTQLHSITAVVQWLDYSPPTKLNRIRFPARPSPDFRICAGRCRWLAGFLEDLPFPPSLHSGAAPHSPRFILVGSREIAVKSRPKLFSFSKFDRNLRLQRRNEGRGETRYPRENPPTDGIVRHDSHLRESDDPAGD
ncbi:hypothetical protein PR048_032727 [Dryococelus australis]|uniref:Uncharacterized protein n=1 Tax=Dryococelus australis TaxID=614101 RepID=A0ABQ9G311_9NEOP|nr:hypothetical protein PR048_032727 [Dryococelus australis]